MVTPRESSRAICSPGKIDKYAADAVVLATGGYGNVFYLSTNARGCNVTATYRAYKKGALFANPCFTQIHPTCIPQSGDYQSKLTLMSESLRNDGRVWVPKRKEDCGKAAERNSGAGSRLLSRAKISELRQSRAARHLIARGQGSLRRRPRRRPGGRGVYLDFADAIKAARRRHDPRALRKLVRDLREDHRRERLQSADANLSRGPLHHGRALG